MILRLAISVEHRLVIDKQTAIGLADTRRWHMHIPC